MKLKRWFKNHPLTMETLVHVVQMHHEPSHHSLYRVPYVVDWWHSVKVQVSSRWTRMLAITLPRLLGVITSSMPTCPCLRRSVHTTIVSTVEKGVLTSYSTIRLLAKSALLPASAITMLGLACRWSSFTHVFARPNVSYKSQYFTVN